MKQKLIMIALATMVLFSACKSKGNSALKDNPFVTEWDTPYGVPPFDKIKNEHYLPAFEEGIRQQLEEIDAICNNEEAPTFENTIEALEYSGALLYKVASVFFNMTSAVNSPELEDCYKNFSFNCKT